MHDKILILDFGSQVTQLIARRVREAHVYCEIHPNDVSDAFVRDFAPKAIILSGSHASTYEEHELRAPQAVWDLGVPVLEIDRERREVITAEGSFPYDQLVLATGSYPFVPPIEGAEGDSRLVYRTLADLDGNETVSRLNIAEAVSYRQRLASFQLAA